MHAITLILCIVSILLPVVVIAWKCINDGRVDLDHVMLYSGAFVYYWVVPFASIFILEAWPQLLDPTTQEFMSFYKTIDINFVVTYQIISLCIYIAFVMGSHFGDTKKNVNDTRLVPIKGNGKGLLKVIFVPILCGLAYYGFKYRNDFFAGYDSESNLADEKGAFVALSILILVIAFVREEISRLNGKVYVNLLSLNRLFWLYFFVAFMILTQGGRLYFISSVVMLAVYVTFIGEKLKLKTLIISLLGFLIMMGMVGTLRNGASLNVDIVLRQSMFESLLSAFSLFGFLLGGRFEFFNFPIYLMSDFVNLIPTGIYSDKLSLVLDPLNDGYAIFNPFGGLHSFISFMVNFGAMGSCIAIFLIGWGMSYLKRTRSNSMHVIFYVMICGWIPFTFFRDPFYVSVVKAVFQLSIVLPLFVEFVASICFKKYYTPLEKH